ncbi:MAG: amidohydrolase [Synergistaceae bacterium]|nr:amidohydrolase [Synergistaceae bacterium]
MAKKTAVGTATQAGSRKYLVGGKVFTGGSDPWLDGATVVVAEGKVEAVGDVPVPRGAEVVDLSGLFVTPGLIDAHTHIGVYNEGFPAAMQDANDMVEPIAPQLRVIDAIYPDDVAFNDALAGGVTCLQSLPGSGNVMGGQGVVVKTKRDVVERMAVTAPSCVKAALGENPVRIYGEKKKYPNTRMGSAWLMRDAFVRAMNYREKMDSAAKKGEPFERNLMMDALLPVLSGELAFRIHCHRSDDIQTAVRVASEFGLNFSIEHCTEGHMIADWLAEKRVRAAVGPTLSSRSKIELRNKTWDTPKVLFEHGVHFCIITDHPVVPIEHLVVCASLAYRAGLPEDEALKAVTVYAAEHLGLDGRVGSIAEGKDADLAVWSGHPLDSRSRVLKTFVNGSAVYERD